ncbi:MAG: hypothetical protein GWN99_19755 [Gemmatimonadetes bacterium]|uniref:Uncharacterized protein n=1 Tax=Candidatus Kutchimonas denitrificans TaxID=3056748 RepID=A0AAE5CD21_9BACT|nr:hypothetical protein [Gemmatimonadota bacterium]NIR76440.1 hypothetical protein [Candidatus Kutchimonas denitrificans]NIS03259.1 hypothetical protein [Gemmatimonadota bacterium]NIT69120.1 hypothetical protein [Gemmatimonadota bacterium]NIU54512.1 hypothetical protein [Gemmatimonadota bacterium]
MNPILRSTLLPAVVAACASAVSADYVVLNTDAEPFRSKFNADADRVRVVMLVAPT